MIDYRWTRFDELSAGNLYEILKIRQEIFAVEQNCVYQDADDLDKSAWHLTAWNNDDSESQEVVGYLRVVYPSYRYDEPSIGRVLTACRVRGTGLGKTLITMALEKIAREYPKQPVRISAQQYLEIFYSTFGFETVTEPYDEDGIFHVEMLRPWQEL